MSAFIGDRLREARKRSALSQRELARASGVSLSLIRKLEQGARQDTRLETLHRLARVLDTTTTALIAEHADDQDPPTPPVPEWAAIRAALDGDVPDIEEEPTVEGVRAACAAAIRRYRAADYSGLGMVLPALIRDADALADVSPQGLTMRMRVLTVTGRLMTQTRQYDAAELALNRAERHIPDQMHAVALINVRCFLLLRRGRLDQARTLAATWADEVEPRLSRATPLEVGAWGFLLLRAAAAAVRDNRVGEAEAALGLAEAAAAVAGQGQSLPHVGLIHEYSRATVDMQRAEFAMVRNAPDEVLRIARGVDFGALPRTGGYRNRHLLDVAQAQVRKRRYVDAVATLMQIQHDAPTWLPHQRYARDIVGQIVARRRTLTPEMRQLADTVRLPL